MNTLIENYINKILEKSTPDKPFWNIEKIKLGSKPKWNYIDGCMISSLIELSKIKDDAKYFDFADMYIDWYVKSDGTIKGYSVDEYNIDNINEGRVLFDLYNKTKKEKYKKAIDLIYKQIQTHPRTKSGNFWHKKIYPNQIWLDGLYMAMPFYMRYETEMNNLENYNDIFQQIMNIKKYLYDKKTGLYVHGYDETKSIFWADKKTGKSKNCWLRAIGWFSVALVDVLDYMDEQIFYEYRQIRNLFKDLIDSVLKYQDQSGLWYQLIAKPELKGNYLETSGSCMLSFAILKGVRLGLLPRTYRKFGKMAFDGIYKNKLKEKNGDINLVDICLVAGLGPFDDLRRDGTSKYYLSEPIVENDAKGLGPFIMAYTEILRMVE